MAKSDYPFLDPPLKPGDIGSIGAYRVLSLLGEGGMGQVFKALDTKLEREVALKVMSIRATANAAAAERFLREARAMAAIKHDNVATIYEVAEHRGTPFLAMELLIGKPLDVAFKNGESFTPQQVIALGRHIARGLAAAHARGIIHRDVKPANIWLEAPTGRPKLLDFGLARSTRLNDSLAQRGAVAGTPAYLSPEQARDDPVDDRTDVYGLGVVLFELLTGRTPFDEPTVVGLLIAILTKQLPEIANTAQTPEPLINLIKQMLAKEPAHRPATAVEVERRLKEAAEAIEHASALPIIALGSPTNLTGKQAIVKPKRNERLIIGGIVAGIVLVLLGVAYWYGNRGRPKEIASQVNVPEPVAERVVSFQDLMSLKLDSVKVLSDEVPQGNAAAFEMHWSNHAVSDEMDPTRLLSGIKNACQLTATIQKENDSNASNAPMLPLRFSARMLPARGETRQNEFRFNTQLLEIGEYELKLSLKVPSGQEVDSKSTKFKVVRNLLVMDLKKFETIRSWHGRGADMTLAAKPSEAPDADKQLVLGRDAQDQVVYMRFDLKRWARPISEIGDAVMSLTLTKDSPQQARSVQVWGVVDGAENALWTEGGGDKLKLSEAPGLKDKSQSRYLGLVQIDNLGGVLSAQRDQVRFASAELVELIKQDQDGLLTLMLIGKADGTPIIFFSKEAEPENAPGLTIVPSDQTAAKP